MLGLTVRSIFCSMLVTFPAYAVSDVVIPTHKTVLDNGLTVIVREDHRMPVLVSQIWYKVGSSYEYDGITGISHLLEHLMFKGTTKHPRGEFSRIIAENGGKQNAFTSYDYTAYYQLLAKDKLPVSFELEADRMRHVILNADDLEKEKEIVLEERRLRTEDVPFSRAQERFNAAAFVSSTYRYPVIGWADDIRSYTLSEVKSWYEQWYSPNNATIVVVGDVSPQDVFALAEKHFGSIPAKKLPVIKQRGEVMPLGERYVEVNIPASMAQIYIGYTAPVVKTAEIGWEPYALTVLSAVLDGGQSARLTKNLIRKKQIAVEVITDYDPFSRKETLFVVAAKPKNSNNIASVKQSLYEEIKKLQTELVSAQELDRIKAMITAQYIYLKDSMSNQAILLGSLESVGLNIELEKQFLENIYNVTPEQLREVANKYLTETRRTVTVLKPLPLS